MTYTPNFQDPRVQRRVRQALGFARACFHETKSRAWSTRYIDRYFGAQQFPLGHWLRQQLLVVTNEYYNMDAGVCKQYRLNATGMQQVTAQLKNDNLLTISVVDLALEFAHKEFKDELSQRKFTYQDLSNRLWHPMQNLRREFKQQALKDSGFGYQYDIECCAPRLLWQHAYLHQDQPMDYIPEYIDAYIRDRNSIRQAIASQVDLDPSAIKVLINALFSGAKLGCNPKFALFKMLEQDRARMTYLQQDPFVTGLRQDIREMWQYIAPSMSRRTICDKNQRTRVVPLTSRDKWTRYFALERRVLDSVIDYLTLTDNPFFAEHDGWTCVNEIDQNSLRVHVQNQTGFDIKLDLEILD
jgi:hypothetical protein